MFQDHDKLDRLSASDCEALITTSTLPVVVLFTASWCTPCVAAEPVLRQLQSAFAGRVAVYAVDRDRATALAAELGIEQLPSVLIFHHGREVDRITGLPARQDLTARLTTLLA